MEKSRGGRMGIEGRKNKAQSENQNKRKILEGD